MARPTLRVEGPVTVLNTMLPLQALGARDKRMSMPTDMPEQLQERCLVRVQVIRAGTDIVAKWLPPGNPGHERRPVDPAADPNLIMHVTADEPGAVCIFSTVNRKHNCHWLLWMTHPECVNWRWRCVWGLDGYSYKQRLSAADPNFFDGEA